MLILGVDPGSKTTGYGIIEKKGNTFQYVEAGIIEPKSKEKSVLFYQLFFALEELLSRYPITEAACEAQFFSKNVKTAMTISNAKTCFLVACGKKNIPVFEYPPKKAKIAVSGHGGSDKTAIQKMLRLHLNLPGHPLPLDASDALSLALCHAFQLKPIQVPYV